MQKKLIAAAVAGALGIPAVALAQNATVNIYGRMYVEYGYVKQGANFGSTINRADVDVLQTPGSSIGFRGEEKLGGGLSAWFQCESTADPRGRSQEGFCGRNSALGLKGAFGNVFVGNWDTPFKRAHLATATGSNITGVFGTASLLTGFSTTAADGAAPQLFSRRQNNSINYDSPSFGGFRVMASTTSVNTATARTSSALNEKPRLWSVAGMYNNGPLAISAAYEKHSDYLPAGVTVFPAIGAFVGDEDGWLVGGSYTFFGKFKLGGMYTRQSWDTTGLPPPFPLGSVGESRVRAWQVGAEWNVAGPHTIKAAYAKAGDVTGNGVAAFGGLRPAAVVGGGTGARMVQARYFYALSKRTDFSVGVNQVRNDTFAGYNINGVGGNGGVGGGASGLGGKHTGYAMALDHRF